MRIKRGDTVRVLVGKDRGKEGKVVRIVTEGRKVVVEGVNMYKRHVKGDGNQKESAIVDIVKPIDVSNVVLLCPACGKSTRVGVVVEGGKKRRVCRKCDKLIEEAEEKVKEPKKTKEQKDKKQTKAKKQKTTKQTTKKKVSKK